MRHRPPAAVAAGAEVVWDEGMPVEAAHLRRARHLQVLLQEVAQLYLELVLVSSRYRGCRDWWRRCGQPRLGGQIGSAACSDVRMPSDLHDASSFSGALGLSSREGWAPARSGIRQAAGCGQGVLVREVECCILGMSKAVVRLVVCSTCPGCVDAEGPGGAVCHGTRGIPGTSRHDCCNTWKHDK